MPSEAALTKISESNKELYGEIKEATEKVKTRGDLSPDLLFRLRDLLKAGSLEQNLHSSFGWLIYFRLKCPRPADFVAKKSELALYLQLQSTRPSTLHSLMLHEAVNLKKENHKAFKFINFLTLWGLDNLREEDWQQFEMKDGNKLPSLVEKIIAVYAKELSKTKATASPEINEMATRAMEKFPTNQYLPVYKAAICASLGQKEEALGYIRDSLMKQPTKSHLWRKAYELAAPVDHKIAFLCKAISLQKEEAFLGNSRHKLAGLLLRKGLPQFALLELQKYHQLYTSKRWSLRKEYDYLREKIPADVRPADDSEIFRKYMPLCEEFLYSALPAERVVKVGERRFDDKYHPGKQNLVWTMKTEGGDKIYLRNPASRGLNATAPDGTAFQAKITDGKIVWIK